jgi:hypothetical protein
MFAEILGALGAATGNPLFAIAGSYIGGQIDQKWFGPVYGVLNDRHITGAAPGTVYPLFGGTWRLDGSVVAALQRKRYTFVGQAKYRGYAAVVLGRCPDINPGDSTGAIIDRWIFNGKTYRNLTKNKERPAFIMDGTQTAAPAGLLLIDPHASAYQGLVACGWNKTRPLHLIPFGNQWPRESSFIVKSTSGGATTLEGLLNGLAREAGVDSSLYDFSECSGVEVRGWGFIGQMTYADYMAKCCEILGAELYVDEGKQKARPKGLITSDDAIRVTWDDMGFTEGPPDAQHDKLRWSVDPKREVPKTIVVQYRNSENDLQAGSVTVVRDDSEGQTTETYDTTLISMNSQEAEAFGYRWLDEQHKKLMHGETSLGIEFSGLRPGQLLDIDVVEDGSRRMIVKIDSIEPADPLGVSTYVLHRVSDGSYTQTGDGGGGGDGTGSGSTDTSAPTAVCISGPEYNPDDPLASQPSFSVWATWDDDTNENGIQLFWRKLGDPDWILVTEGGDTEFCAIQNRTPIGTATSILADGTTPVAFEGGRTVDLTLDQTSDELIDSTEATILSGYQSESNDSNGCILVKDATGEVFCFANATDHGSGTWTIDDVLTGLYGSAYTDHISGERFVCFTRGDGRRVVVPQALVGQQVEILPQEQGGDFSGTTYIVTIAAPGTNAKDPDEIVASGPSWLQGQMFRIFQVRYTTQDPSVTLNKYRWQRNLNSGGFVGPGGDPTKYWYTSEVFQDSIVRGDTLQIRAWAISPNGSVSSPVTTSNFLYIFNSNDGMASPVRAATTTALPAYSYSSHVYTASANGALPAIDGVTLAVGDSLLIKDEVDLTKNGIAVVNDLGSVGTPFVLTRRDDFDASDEIVPSVLVAVQEGSTYADHVFELTSDGPIVLDASDLVFDDVGTFTGGGGGATWSYDETPTGTINGTNGTFTLAHSPLSIDDLTLKVDGVPLVPTNDFTLSGAVITIADADHAPEVTIRADYPY